MSATDGGSDGGVGGETAIVGRVKWCVAGMRPTPSVFVVTHTTRSGAGL
jgi:hypothetical protein